MSRALDRPIAMFVDQSDDAMIGAAIDAGVSAYVVDGLRKERVKPVLELAVRRFNAFARMQSELDEARTALADRKIIDRAKSILMNQRSLSEQDAYALLRSSAMNQEEAKGPIMEHLLKAGCGARPTDGQAAQDKTEEEEEDGAWAPSEEWWGYQQEIAMCHEVIDELMSSR